MSDSASEPSGTVLVVEDEVSLVELFTVWLSDTHEVRTAQDGHEALAKLDADIDVVLLDRRMPGLTGDEVLERIRKQEYNCQVAMVTGVSPGIELADMPIDDYLIKPVDRETLRKSVTDLLLRSREDLGKRELLALVSRKRALNAEKTEAELENDRRYLELERRIERATAQLDGEIRTAPSKYVRDACPECNLRWDVRVAGVAGFVELGSYVLKCLRCGEIVHHQESTGRRFVR